jgi:hypothetical protein
MENFMELNGVKYPVREVEVNDSGEDITYLIGTESLCSAIFNHNADTQQDEYTSDEALTIDEQIFFYAPDDVLFSDNLIQFLKENVDVEMLRDVTFPE